MFITAKAILAREGAITMYCEGGRSRTGKLAEHAKPGIGRLALETGAPIVPVAVIGAEEQAPAVNAASIAKLLRVPSFPIVPYPPFIAPVPLPVKYRIYFGEPMTFTGDADDDDEILDDKVKTVRNRIQSMIQVGLREREHVFW
jgi:1-acyl-sn-glycerol-3-phosphate acyltransferase